MVLVVLEDCDGLVFYPPHQIASLTPFLCGWWRAVTASGEVLHLPQLPPGPWLTLGASRGLPYLLTRVGTDLWRDPAGFLHQGLPSGSCEPPPPPRLLEPLGCTSQEVRGARLRNGDCIWLTEQGEIPGRFSEPEMSSHFSWLVELGAGLYGNRERFRRLRQREARFELVLDDGSVFETMYIARARALAGRLGLSRPDRLTPVIEGLREYGLRDWPFELYRAEAEQLKACFSDLNVLIANLILQTVRYLMSHPEIEYGKDLRGFWYKPVCTVLYRAGFIEEEQMRMIASETKNEAYERLGRIADRMVSGLRLFSYRDMGFEDPGKRSIGSSRPDILLLVEKSSLKSYASKLQARFGLSYYISGGSTKVLDVEYLAAELLSLGISEVQLFCFVDFDPAGTALAEGLVPQLERYGIKIRGDLKMVVHPDCFTQEELRLFALPCPSGSVGSATLAERWVEKTGGIQGQLMGIGADHLAPFERVVQRFEELGC